MPWHEQLLASLRTSTSLGRTAGGLVVGRVAELTPGLSGARVFRVPVCLEEGVATAQRRSLILKTVDPDARTGIAPRDPDVATREARFYESGLGARLPACPPGCGPRGC